MWCSPYDIICQWFTPLTQTVGGSVSTFLGARGNSNIYFPPCQKIALTIRLWGITGDRFTTLPVETSTFHGRIQDIPESVSAPERVGLSCQVVRTVAWAGGFLRSSPYSNYFFYIKSLDKRMN